MRIGIDVRYLSHGLVGGVHRYVAQLVPAVVQAAPEHQFFLYADTKRPFELQDLPDNAVVRFSNYRNALSSVWLDFNLRRVMAADGLDVVHFPANYGFGPAGARAIITLHDHINILPLWEIIRGHRKQPGTMAMMTYLNFCSTQALRHAHLLVTVSNYSKNQILANCRFNPDRIVVWTHGTSTQFKRITDQRILDDVRQRHSLTRPFVLADAVKNPDALVNAWKLLPDSLRQTFQMVFFSRTPAPPPSVFEAQAAGYARLLVRASHEDLMALYSMADAFVFPSWYEGLGLPLLEAMIAGAPIIASDRGSIPEVAGDAALMSDVEDTAALARNIECVLTNPAEAERLRQRGFARAPQFSWENTAKRYLEIYEQARALPLNTR